METIHVDLSRVSFEEQIDIDLEIGNQPEVVIDLEDSKAAKFEGFREGLVGRGQGGAPCGGEEAGRGGERIGEGIGDHWEGSLAKSGGKNLEISAGGQNHSKIDPKSGHGSHSLLNAKTGVAQTGPADADGHKAAGERSEPRAVVEIDEEFSFSARGKLERKEGEAGRDEGMKVEVAGTQRSLYKKQIDAINDYLTKDRGVGGQVGGEIEREAEGLRRQHRPSAESCREVDEAGKEGPFDAQTGGTQTEDLLDDRRTDEDGRVDGAGSEARQDEPKTFDESSKFEFQKEFRRDERNAQIDQSQVQIRNEPGSSGQSAEAPKQEVQDRTPDRSSERLFESIKDTPRFEPKNACEVELCLPKLIRAAPTPPQAEKPLPEHPRPWIIPKPKPKARRSKSKPISRNLDYYFSDKIHLNEATASSLANQQASASIRRSRSFNKAKPNPKKPEKPKANRLKRAKTHSESEEDRLLSDDGSEVDFGPPRKSRAQTSGKDKSEKPKSIGKFRKFR